MSGELCAAAYPSGCLFGRPTCGAGPLFAVAGRQLRLRVHALLLVCVSTRSLQSQYVCCGSQTCLQGGCSLLGAPPLFRRPELQSPTCGCPILRTVCCSRAYALCARRCVSARQHCLLPGWPRHVLAGCCFSGQLHTGMSPMFPLLPHALPLLCLVNGCAACEL